MRRAWHTTPAGRPRAWLLIAAVVLLNPSLRAQTLELPHVIEAPTLQLPTYAADLIKDLEGEIVAMRDPSRAADPAQKTVTRASINVRKIAANLLAFGDRAGKDGSTAVLAGVRLARGREEIDRLLKKALEPGAADNGSVLNSLRSFNDDAEALIGDGRAFMDRDLDSVLQSTFRTFADAIGELEHTPIVSHWPSSPNAPAPASRPTLVDLATQVQQAPIPPAARDELASIIDFLQRGEDFPELRPRIELYRTLVGKLLDAAQVIAASTWLGSDDRSAFDARIRSAALLFKDPKTRDAGERQIERLNTSRLVIERIDALQAEHVDVKPIAKALLAAESNANEEDGESARQQISAIAGILERMLAYRQLPEAHLKRDLRLVERDLHKAYRTAEEALLKQIASLTASSRPLADPAISSLLVEQKQLLADLERIAKAPAWMDAIAAIDKNAGDAFEKQVQKMSRGLPDPNRRPDSIAAMNEFERQLGMFAQLPFEVQLRDGDPGAVSATGALHSQLLAMIKQQRQKWAQAWGDGNAASEAGNRMAQLHRLTSAMADMSEVARDGGDAALLNRWSAWMLDPDLNRRPMSDVASRLKLATAAAVQGDDNGLAQQLDKIDHDAPLVKLVGRLTAMIGGQLRELPNGAPGIAGELTQPPGPDAWMVQHRNELASICRYAMEQEHARAAGQADIAAALNELVMAAANQLLNELGEPRSTLPAVSGFDGSDPNPKLK